MRLRIVLSVAVIAALTLSCAVGDRTEETAVDADQLGLSKTSVFATPDPVVAGSSAGEPGENETVEAYFSGAPPLIPHQVADFMPIRIDENMCLECHDLRDQIDAATEPGDPTPMPASHYTDLRREPNDVTQQVIGARFDCSLCHALQADAQPLVANTYAQ
jgi:cytochrome c-type protein NapB